MSGFHFLFVRNLVTAIGFGFLRFFSSFLVFFPRSEGFLFRSSDFRYRFRFVSPSLSVCCVLRSGFVVYLIVVWRDGGDSQRRLDHDS